MLHLNSPYDGHLFTTTTFLSPGGDPCGPCCSIVQASKEIDRYKQINRRQPRRFLLRSYSFVPRLGSKVFLCRVFCC